jgi:hypothetical protein
MVRDPGLDGLGPRRRSGSFSAYVQTVLATPGARTVHDGVERRLLRSRPRSRLLGGNPSRRRDPMVCFEAGMPPKMPLVDVEPKRGKYSK